MCCSRHFQPRKGPNREIPSPWSRTCVWTFVWSSTTGCSSAVFVNSPAAAAPVLSRVGSLGTRSSAATAAASLGHVTCTLPHLLITSPAPAVDVAIWTTPHVGMYQLVSACCLKVDIKNQRKTNTYLGKKGKIGQPNIRSDASNGGRDDERWVDPTLYSLSRCHQHCLQLCCWTSAAPAFKSGIWYQTSVIFHFPVKLGIFVKSW